MKDELMVSGMENSFSCHWGGWSKGKKGPY